MYAAQSLALKGGVRVSSTKGCAPELPGESQLCFEVVCSPAMGVTKWLLGPKESLLTVQDEFPALKLPACRSAPLPRTGLCLD